MENFNFEKIKQLSQNDAKAYLTKYFVPLSNGDHAMLKNGKYEIRPDAEVKKTYFNRLPKNIVDYYLKEFSEIKTITCQLNKPTFFDGQINICPKLKHQYSPYKAFPDAIKAQVQKVLSFIKQIWCSQNNESYKFVEKWLANMLKGNKNNSCLYLKSAVQGMGKSTIPTFIRDHVIGESLALETGSEPIKNKFNAILEGRLMVVLEELENFGSAEWQAISTRLKRYITSNTINIEKKNFDPYDTLNINNYILISNNDAIKDDEGRRYFILDLCTAFVGVQSYFDDVYSCFSDEVGKAFYCYMLEVDTDKFNPQDYPLTQSKADSIAKRLDPVFHYLKEDFILVKREIFSTVDELFEDYKCFCIKNDYKPCGKIDFCKKMKDVGLSPYKASGGKVNKYKFSHETLLDVATKFKWVHDLDEFTEGKVTAIVDYQSKYEELKKQFDDYKAQNPTKTIIEEEVEPDVQLYVKPQEKKHKKTKINIISDKNETEKVQKAEQSLEDLEKELSGISDNILNLI